MLMAAKTKGSQTLLLALYWSQSSDVQS
jgi:hypothetical protein